MKRNIIKSFVYPLKISKGTFQARMIRSNEQAVQYFNATVRNFSDGDVHLKTLEKNMNDIVNYPLINVRFFGHRHVNSSSFVHFDSDSPILRVAIPAAETLNRLEKTVFGKIINKNVEEPNHEALHIFDLINNPKIVARALKISDSKKFKQIDEFFTNHLYGNFNDTKHMSRNIVKIENSLRKFLKNTKLQEQINILQYYRNNCLMESRAYNWGAKCQQKFNTEQNCKESLVHLFQFSIFFKRKYEMLNKLLFETIEKERIKMHKRR